MKITLTPQESEEYFLNALCNGLAKVTNYGLGLDYEQKEYTEAREKLTNPCYEEVLMQMLRDGKRITMVDVEGEGDMTRSICLQDIHERVQKTPHEHLMDMVDENDDVITADVILQTVFFSDIIFG